MNYSTVLMTSDHERAAENKKRFLEIYRCIESEHPELCRRCRKLRIRARKAYERLTYKPKWTGYVTDSHDESFYDWLDEINEREHAEMDGDFPLGNEADAAHANLIFTMDEVACIQCGLFDGIKPETDDVMFSSPEDTALLRRAFLCELRGEWYEAIDTYRRLSALVFATKEVIARFESCKKRLEEGSVGEKCINHPDREGVAHCASCKRPLCEECAGENQIYSVSAEEGLPYCKKCYESALRSLR